MWVRAAVSEFAAQKLGKGKEVSACMSFPTPVWGAQGTQDLKSLAFTLLPVKYMHLDF